MDGKASLRVVDPNDNKKPGLFRIPDHRVIGERPAHLGGLEPFWVVQHLLHLFSADATFGVIPLEVSDVAGVPDNWAVVHPSHSIYVSFDVAYASHIYILKTDNRRVCVAAPAPAAGASGELALPDYVRPRCCRLAANGRPAAA